MHVECDIPVAAKLAAPDNTGGKRYPYLYFVAGVRLRANRTRRGNGPRHLSHCQGGYNIMRGQGRTYSWRYAKNLKDVSQKAHVCCEVEVVVVSQVLAVEGVPYFFSMPVILVCDVFIAKAAVEVVLLIIQAHAKTKSDNF